MAQLSRDITCRHVRTSHSSGGGEIKAWFLQIIAILHDHFAVLRYCTYPSDFYGQGLLWGGAGIHIWRTSVVLNEEPNIRNSNPTPHRPPIHAPRFQVLFPIHTESDTPTAVSGRTYMYLTQLGYCACMVSCGTVVPWYPWNKLKLLNWSNATGTLTTGSSHTHIQASVFEKNTCIQGSRVSITMSNPWQAERRDAAREDIGTWCMRNYVY